MNISYVRSRRQRGQTVFDEFFENVLNPTSLVNENQVLREAQTGVAVFGASGWSNSMCNEL